jgi:two-component sensor histidine kinase
MDIGELVRTELAPYMNDYADAITLEGRTYLLPRELVQTFALAIHELTTNSVKHGALSKEGGKLKVSWGLDPELLLEWTETGLTEIKKPAKQGFGTNLLTRILPAQNVEVDLRYRDTGLNAKISRGK